MIEIPMPQLSDAMEEGTIIAWLKQGGDHVERGEELVEIETDKATMTYESPESGILEIVAAEGDTLAVGEPMARVGTEAADAGGQGAPGDAAAGSEAPAAAEPPPEASDGRAASAKLAAPSVATTAPAAAPASANGRGPATPRATPLARRVAEKHGVDLATVSGSGPRGRITRADVAAKAGLPSPAAQPPAAPERSAAGEPDPGAAPARSGVEVQELSRLQQVVARRMAEAKATIPHFQVETEVLMDPAIALRARLKELSGEAPPPSFNDLVVKAVASALREHARANGSYKDGRFELRPDINVGVAVATEDSLVVPVVTEADKKSLGQIAADTRRLAARVRDRSIAPPELSGGTFTISNLGMYGMTAISPVINPPQAAILGVGAMRAVPALVGGKLTERHLMTLTLSCDHRILYGAEAARFLDAIRQLLEQPLRLAL